MKKITQLAPSECSPESDLTHIVITSPMDGDNNNNSASVKINGLSTPIASVDDSTFEKGHEESHEQKEEKKNSTLWSSKYNAESKSFVPIAQSSRWFW